MQIPEKISFICLMLLTVIVFLSGCTKSDKKEVELIKQSVMRYDQLLEAAYVMMVPGPLKEIATEEQTRKVMHHMYALKEGGIRIESELKEMEFLDINFLDDKRAIVRTKEIWDFRQVNFKTDKVVLDEKDVIHNLSYELIKENDKWLVNSVSVAEK